jgi:hypothetical protein
MPQSNLALVPYSSSLDTDDDSYCSEDSLDDKPLYLSAYDEFMEHARNILGVNDISRHVKTILQRDRDIVSIRGSKYVYINEEMGWTLLYSDTTARKVSEMMSLDHSLGQ